MLPRNKDNETTHEPHQCCSCQKLPRQQRSLLKQRLMAPQRLCSTRHLADVSNRAQGAVSMISCCTFLTRASRDMSICLSPMSTMKPPMMTGSTICVSSNFSPGFSSLLSPSFTSTSSSSSSSSAVVTVALTSPRTAAMMSPKVSTILENSGSRSDSASSAMKRAVVGSSCRSSDTVFNAAIFFSRGMVGSCRKLAKSSFSSARSWTS
mmetsp:Transcript_15519/g.46873  ORF Transcript_15519/g.46873 Transcript_15519/m.46873 type:complete len:208 (+) Transcript_15519:20-643(+)